MLRGYMQIILWLSVLALLFPGRAASGASLTSASAAEVDSIVGPFQAVPLYNQLPRWPSGCGPYSLAMVLSFTYRVYFDPDRLAREAVTAGLFTPYLPPYTSPVGLAQLAMPYSLVSSGNIKDEAQAQTFLHDQLQAGLPVIVDVMIVFQSGAWPNPENTHFVVVTGMDADHHVYVNDPLGYRDANHKTASRRTVAWDTFWYMWQNNGDARGTGNGWWLTLARLPMDGSDDFQ
jgi:predicted double-glycine peptidase